MKAGQLDVALPALYSLLPTPTPSAATIGSVEDHPPIPRLGEEEEAVGNEAERDETQEQGAEGPCGQGGEGAVDAARLARVGAQRGIEEEDADQAEDDAARGIADP